MLCWLTGLSRSYADGIVIFDAATADAWARLSVPEPHAVIDGLLVTR
jgi:hypothetical protein